ncbi:MAG: hypothetical protein M0R30_06940 [Methanoregula sp.]|jgi:hypothetical protein|uniref:hypothetical protein n=1 Tax=Methanoregula sp. TaxID=2052170 RepID=UPI002600E7C1|nr:hypothetical protein [Methanoregula sp.]MCK9631363.1 hypothetical protein [Methanoregula sp.]
MNQLTKTILISAFIMCLCVLPAAAVVQEVTVKGTVSAINKEESTLTIADPLQYGCSYPASGGPVCSYMAMDVTTLTGNVPSESAWTLFKTGDTVVATSLGGAGGSWITIAKLYNSLPVGEYVTSLVGDPGAIPTPLVGNYAVDTITVPDCTSCSGTTCKATTSTVFVLSSGTRVFEETLAPRQVMLYNGRNDGSSVEVTFVKGEASSDTCAGRTGMTGMQPVSVYIVNVVPPVGFDQQFITTPTTATPEPTLPVPTTHSGNLPLAVIGAAGLGAALLALRRK